MKWMPLILKGDPFKTETSIFSSSVKNLAILINYFYEHKTKLGLHG